MDVYKRDNEGRKWTRIEMRGSHLLSAHFHWNVSYDDMVEHTHPGGCHFHVRLLFLEQPGRVKRSNQRLTWVVDKKL